MEIPSKRGGPAIPLAVRIIKEKLRSSDQKAVEQIRKNPYLPCFIVLKNYRSDAPFGGSNQSEHENRMWHEALDHCRRWIELDGAAAVEQRQQGL
jgi:hypothetical protein